MCSLYVSYIAIIYLANIYIISTVPQHPQILATPLATGPELLTHNVQLPCQKLIRRYINQHIFFH